MKLAITDVRGIGESTREILSRHGVDTLEALATLSIDKLISIPGFSGVRAGRVIGDAKALLAKREEAAVSATVTEQPQKARKEKKGKKSERKPKKVGKKSDGKKKLKSKQKDKKSKKETQSAKTKRK